MNIRDTTKYVLSALGLPLFLSMSLLVVHRPKELKPFINQIDNSIHRICTELLGQSCANPHASSSLQIGFVDTLSHSIFLWCIWNSLLSSDPMRVVVLLKLLTVTLSSITSPKILRL